MNRRQAIEYICDCSAKDAIIIASTGLISRELYRVEDRALNFYMMGSMGCALAIGLGVALNVGCEVHVISGDGAALMGMGSTQTFKSIDPENLFYWILDNGCHESTGGQKTNFDKKVFEQMGANVIEIEKDEDIPPRIDLTPIQIQKRFRHAVNAISHK